MVKICVQPTICTVARFTTRRETCGLVVWISCAFVFRCVAGIALRSQALKLPGGSALVAGLAIQCCMRSD